MSLEEDAFERALEETKDRDERSLPELAEAARPYWKGGDGLEYQCRLREEWTRPWDPEANESASRCWLSSTIANWLRATRAVSIRMRTAL